MSFVLFFFYVIHRILLTLYDSNLQRAKRNTIGYSHIQVEPFYPIIRLIVAVPKPTINIIYLQRHISLIKFDIQNTYAERIATTEIEKELIKKSIQESETIFNSRMEFWFN